MGHVQCPQSESANNDLQPGRSRLVPATYCRRAGIDRETVGRYLGLAKPAISTTGVEEGAAAKRAIAITRKMAGQDESKPAISITGIAFGRRSYCEPLAEAIAAKVEIGLSARVSTRIW
jgi:hypothetical protein